MSNQSAATVSFPESVRYHADNLHQVLSVLFNKNKAMVVIPSVLLAEFIRLLEMSPRVQERVRQVDWIFDDRTECLTLCPRC